VGAEFLTAGWLVSEWVDLDGEQDMVWYGHRIEYIQCIAGFAVEIEEEVEASWIRYECQ
jgi:hypothetical protein